MYEPLLRFLKTGNLDEVSLGMAMAEVISALGTPAWWEGRHELTREQSGLWRYGDLQLVFDDSARVESISVYFGGETFPPSDTGYDGPCFAAHVNSETTLEDFVAFLEEHTIPFERDEDFVGKPLICVPNGAAATLSHRRDRERSMAEGRPTKTANAYLLNIRSGKYIARLSQQPTKHKR